MASGIWHLACQTYALKLFNFHRSRNQTQFLFSSARSFRVAKSAPSSRFLLAMFSADSSTTFSETSLVRSSATFSAKLSSISKRLLKPPLVYKPPLWFRASLLSKSELFFASLLLLSYTQGSVALTPCSQPFMACTSRVIEGSAPYLAFNYGLTKATDTDSLLSIRLEDGRVITPSSNTSSVSNPISLPRANSRLGDIGMIFPPLTASSVSLSDLATRFGYWRDDDGDEPAANGVSGSISVSFTDKDGNTVGRNEALSKCKAPYRVTLSSTGGYLQTQYGVPNRTNFSNQRVTYYINPYDSGSGGCYFVRYARPNRYFGGTGNNVSFPRGERARDGSYFAGPSGIWSRTKGFLTQSNDSSSYDRNFPTTGADGLYFDLEMPAGVDGSQLSWTVNTVGSIRAEVSWRLPNQSTFRESLSGQAIRADMWISDRSSYVTRVTLRGPNLSQISVPSLPQTFELVGRDSRGNEVRYGFVLKQWFVHRNIYASQSGQSTWCSSLGYRMPSVSDLTNAKCGISSSFPCVNGIDGALPHSSGNIYMRHIGSGFFTEWGDMLFYADASFAFTYYWTSDASGSLGFHVAPHQGDVLSGSVSYSYYGVCTAP
ncbi:hypothetical protein [Gilliamella sp. Pas-s95]|uniref:hypothetical protein n=1 Tax=Gilliamella sp. Pas-s95 TaxID=2687317 RepID=UPI00132595BF|nr:hypothetical protein [Gilliamella sp. Pas-s95]MWN06630.1 hypothetical protein [Gilliamella sp. Pas-s95]